MKISVCIIVKNEEKVIDAIEVERYTTAVDICAHWAEYKIKPYSKSNICENFTDFRTQVESVLSLPEILERDSSIR